MPTRCLAALLILAACSDDSAPTTPAHSTGTPPAGDDSMADDTGPIFPPLPPVPPVHDFADHPCDTIGQGLGLSLVPTEGIYDVLPITSFSAKVEWTWPGEGGWAWRGDAAADGDATALGDPGPPPPPELAAYYFTVVEPNAADVAWAQVGGGYTTYGPGGDAGATEALQLDIAGHGSKIAVAPAAGGPSRWTFHRLAYGVSRAGGPQTTGAAALENPEPIVVDGLKWWPSAGYCTQVEGPVALIPDLG